MLSLRDRFYFALSERTLFVIQNVVEEGFDIEEKGSYGCPLLSAISSSDFETIMYLIPFAKKINPLLFIIKENMLNSQEKLEIIEYLLSFGHDINITDEDNKGALMLAIENYDTNYKVVEFLINNEKYNFKNRDCHGNNALMYACNYGIRDESILNILLKNIGINKKNNIRQTALHIAVCAEEDYIVMLLLSRGASTEIRDSKRNKPKYYAWKSSSTYSYL